MPGGFEVADGYVTIHAKVDSASIETAAGQAAEDFDVALSRGYDGSSFSSKVEKVAKDAGTSLEGEFGKSGGSSGHTFLDGFEKSVKDELGGGNSNKSSGLFSGLVSGISDSFSGIPGELKAALIGGAVIASPFIGAAVAGAITAGVALAGIAGGIALEFHDPQITAAGSGLGKFLHDTLTTAASSFVEPTLNSISVLDGVIAKEGSRFKSIFDALAPSVQGLAIGFGQFIDKALPGLETLSKASLPILAEISGQLPGLGNAVGDLFRDLASSAKGAGESIVAAFKASEYAIEATGVAVEALSKSFDWAVNSPIASFLGGLTWTLFAQKVREGSDTAGKSVDTFADYETNAAAATDRLNAALSKESDSFDKLFNKVLAAENSNLKFLDDVDSLTKALQNNGGTLDQNTAKGRANAEALLATAQAAEDSRTANIANGMSVTDANAKYGAQIQQLYKVGAQYGLTKQQVDKLIGSINAVPKTKTTTISSNAAQVKANVDALKNSLDALHDHSFTVTEYIDILTSGHQPGVSTQNSNQGGIGNMLGDHRLGGIQRAATGLISGPSTTAAGIYADGPLTMFAEPSTVQEAYIPMVTPDPARRLAVLAEAASWAGLSLVPGGSAGGAARAVQPAVAAPASPPTVNQYFGYDPGAERAADMRRQAQAALAVTR